MEYVVGGEADHIEKTLLFQILVNLRPRTGQETRQLEDLGGLGNREKGL